MIDTLKRFWRQNWHRILSAFAVLVVVISIAFSCGVNASALEITPDEYRYIDVSIRQIDIDETVEVNFDLSPPAYPSPDIIYAYPSVDWYYFQEGIVLSTGSSYTYDEDNGEAQSSVEHMVYIDSGDGDISYVPTVTYFELDEFSALPSVIANGQSTDAFYPSDPYSYIGFQNDSYCTAQITLVIARAESNGSVTFKEVYYDDPSYYLAEYSSVYQYLVHNINASNFVYYPEGVTTVYRPAEREFISSVRIVTYDSDFATIGAPTPQYTSTRVTHRPYYASGLNLTHIMSILRRSGDFSDYEAGYIDGKNAGLTENFGVVDWLVNAGDSVMNFQLFRVGDTSVTIGSIFTVIVGSLLIIFILKVFAGG